MSTYSVAEAKDRFSSMLSEAERGEIVTITRHGRPIVEGRAAGDAGRKFDANSLDWLDAQLAAIGLLPTRSLAVLEAMRAERDRG